MSSEVASLGSVCPFCFAASDRLDFARSIDEDAATALRCAARGNLDLDHGRSRTILESMAS
eukprot:6172137-Pleurochrysis_carterae.AAC.1